MLQMQKYGREAISCLASYSKNKNNVREKTKKCVFLSQKDSSCCIVQTKTAVVLVKTQPLETFLKTRTGGCE